MGARSSTTSHADDRTRAIETAKDQIKMYRDHPVQQNQSLILFSGQKNVLADLAVSQLDRQGQEFNKNDLIAILAKLMDIRDANGLRDLSMYSIVDLRTAIRVSVYTPPTASVPQPSSGL